MTALSAGSLTYTVSNKRRLGNSKVMNRCNIVLAAGQTYVTGGLTIGTGTTYNSGVLGCPNTIESLIVSDAGTGGYVWNFNTLTSRLQMFVATTTGTPSALIEVAATVTPGALSIYADVIGW